MIIKDRKKIPNYLTVGRFFLALVCIILLFLGQHSSSAPNVYLDCNAYTFSSGIIFLLAVFSDFLDGFLARRWKAITDWGKAFDPIADKFLIIGCTITLVIYGRIYLILGLALIIRDVVMDIMRIILLRRGVVIAAIFTAKVKTCLQMLSLAIIIFFYSDKSQSTFSTDHNFLIPFTLLSLSSIFSIISFIQYLKLIFRRRVR